jgi:hypothetical protein
VSFGGIDLGDAAWARLLGRVAQSHTILAMLCGHSNETPLRHRQCFVTSFIIEVPSVEA